MTTDLADPDFWSGCSEYQKIVHAFTSAYARDAWALAALPTGARVLDVACGAGALALVAAAAGAEVLATDFSPGMVEAVRSHGAASLRAEVMDGQALDLPDASFDAAFSMFGVMLFPDWRKGLAELVRVVRPGGLAVLGTWKEPSGAATNLLLARWVERTFPEVTASAPVGGLEQLRDEERLRQEMDRAGVDRVQIAEVSHDFPLRQEDLAEPDRAFQFSPL